MTEPQRFRVLAWPADRRIVLYVPDIEASTVVSDLRQAEDAARDLIADLTGLDPATFTCEITFGRTIPS